MVIPLFDIILCHREVNFTALQVIFAKHKITKGSLSDSTVSCECLCQVVWGANGFRLFLEHVLKGKKTYLFCLHVRGWSSILYHQNDCFKQYFHFKIFWSKLFSFPSILALHRVCVVLSKQQRGELLLQHWLVPKSLKVTVSLHTEKEKKKAKKKKKAIST